MCYTTKVKLAKMLIFAIHFTFAIQTSLGQLGQGKYDMQLTSEIPWGYFVKSAHQFSSIAITIDSQAPTCTYNETFFLQWVIIGTQCHYKYKDLNTKTGIQFFYNCWHDPKWCGQTDRDVYLYNYNTLNSTGKGYGIQVKCNETSKVKWLKSWEGMKGPLDRNTLEKSGLGIPLTENQIAETPVTAEYMVITVMKSYDTFPEDMILPVEIEIKSPFGYLSVEDYHLLTMYMIMFIIYALLAVVWSAISACNYRALLRIHYWCGAIVFLGLIEEGVNFFTFLTANTTGIKQEGFLKFADIIADIGNTITRLLLLFLSMGYGILRLQLDQSGCKIRVFAILYLACAVVGRIALLATGNRKIWLYGIIPLAILDLVLWIWVYVSLFCTIKILRSQKMVNKLRFFYIYSATIVICSFAAIGYSIWSIKMHQADCLENLETQWIERAYSQALSLVLLMIIMCLLRVSKNNQYLYSPVLNEDEEETQSENLKMQPLVSK